MSLRVVESGRRSSVEQMQLDEACLLGVDQPFLRFYGWKDFAVTFGYFIDPAEWIDTHNLDHARRPTGGGLIFHEHDLSFTLALPVEHPFCLLPSLERYQKINEAVLQACGRLIPAMACLLQQDDVASHPHLELCMAHPTKYDLLLGGKKVGGASQRKNKKAFIHQCSLFLAPPDWKRIEKHLLDRSILSVLQSVSGSLFSSVEESLEFRSEIKNHLPDLIHSIL